ncbi:DUF3991 domain-containing protein [Verrucomicrobiota bacterium]
MTHKPIAKRTDHLRAIPLPDVLHAAGARADPHDPAKWHTARGVLSVNGTKFFNWNEGRGGGGAIDLAMHLSTTSFLDALDWLARLPAASQPQPLRQRPAAQTPLSAHLALPPPAAVRLPAVLRYLTGKRRLPRGLIQGLIGAGNLYADQRANAVFVLRDEQNIPVGAERRSTGTRSWRGMAPGSRRDRGYFAIAPAHPTTVILCESAIDAISCRLLCPHALCVSTAGARPDPAWLPALLTRNLPVFCGFDADPTGERIALSMTARYPDVQRLRPPHHDWNDTLRARS